MPQVRLGHGPTDMQDGVTVVALDLEGEEREVPRGSAVRVARGDQTEGRPPQEVPLPPDIES